MNGKLGIHSIKRTLSAKVDHLNTFLTGDAEFTVSEIRDMMAALTEDMVKAANSNPNREARMILANGDDNQTGDYYLTHKIQAIKTIRERSGCGLKEAKDAYEQEIPPFLKDRAERALRDLATANKVAGFRYAAIITADDHSEAVSTLSF